MRKTSYISLVMIKYILKKFIQYKWVIKDAIFHIYDRRLCCILGEGQMRTLRLPDNR